VILLRISNAPPLCGLRFRDLPRPDRESIASMLGEYKIGIASSLRHVMTTASIRPLGGGAAIL
jgi:hypothetical protein